MEGGGGDAQGGVALLLPLLQSLFCLFLVSSIARLWQENEAQLQMRQARQGRSRLWAPVPPAPPPVPPRPPLYTLVRMQVSQTPV